jgi:hypothetical protein
MQKPASPPPSRPLCPTCNRPVRPGYKFCETCGTRLPHLSTCSKCGTQFVTPLKYCELCGAPVILEGVTVPEDPESPVGENRETVQDRTPEPDDEDILEPDTGEVSEGDDAGQGVPGEDEAPRHSQREIREPDTEELLEKFGKEYDVNETLESSRTPKSRSPGKQGGKKAATGSARPKRGAPESVDEALFMMPGKPEKPRSTGIWIAGGGLALIALIAAAYFIGLPMFADSGTSGTGSVPLTAENTSMPVTMNRTPAPSMTATPVPSSGALVPRPTVTIPSGQKLYFRVQKSPITAKILVTFAGSAGHGSISSADIKITHPDGSVATGLILPLKGVTEIVLDGSEETDRVEIIALMSDGETYRVYDELVPFIQ